MGEGFTVRAGELATGGKNVAVLQGDCEKTGSSALTAISGLGGAAGSGALSAALLAAAEQGTKTFLDIGAAFQNASTNLDATAASYGQSENDTATRISTIGNDAR